MSLTDPNGFYEPEEGDYITTDHRTFYQDGKRVLVLEQDGDWQAAVRAHMEREQFWPNVWFLSDHGNCHLISVRKEGE